MKKLLRPALVLIGIATCLHNTSCGKREEADPGGNPEAVSGAMVPDPASGPVALDGPPPGTTAISFMKDGERRIRIALECRPAAGLDADRSLILTPWPDTAAPAHSFQWHDGRWRPVGDLVARDGVLLGRGAGDPDDLPEIDAWFAAPAGGPAAVHLRRSTGERTDAEQRALERARERREEHNREIEAQIEEIEAEIQDLRDEQRELQRRRPRPDRVDPRERRRPFEDRRALTRELSDLNHERSRLISRIETGDKQAPDFEIEYVGLTNAPAVDALPDGGVAIPGASLITGDGPLPDPATLLQLLEPGLEDVRAWIDWNRSQLTMTASGSIGGAAQGSTIEMRPTGNAGKSVTSHGRASRIGKNGSFSHSVSLEQPQGDGETPLEIELVLTGSDDHETPLGRWSAVLQGAHCRAPLRPVRGEHLLPWAAPSTSDNEPESDVEIVSMTDHPLGGRLIDIAEVGQGERFAVVVEGHGALRWFDRRTETWSDGPAVEGPRARVAGDAHRVFILDRAGDRLRSFSLTDGSALAEVDPGGDILDLAAGPSSSAGPLVIMTPTHVALLDPATLMPLSRLAQPQQTSGRPPAIGSRADLAHRSSQAPVISGEIHAAPDASSFLIRHSSDPARNLHDSWTLSSDGLIWHLGRGSEFPGWRGGRYTASSFIPPDRSERRQIRIDTMSIRSLLPTLGAGHLCVASPQRSTIPPCPVWVAYDTGDGDAVRFQSHSLAHDLEGLVSDRIWFDPLRARLTTARDTVLRVEQLDSKGFSTRVPPAWRVPVPPRALPGSSWSYSPGDAGSIGLEPPPTAPSLRNPDGTLTWEVPSDFPGGTLDLKLTLDGTAFDVEVPVGSFEPAVFRSPSGETHAIASHVLPLEGADRLIAIPGSPFVLATRNGGAGLSLVDTEKQAVVRTVWLPGGVASPAIAGELIHLYYPEMDIIETRQLDDFSPIRSAPLSFELPVQGITAAAQAPLRAVLRKTFHQIELVEIDTETMTPAATTMIEGPRFEDDGRLVPITSSPDGSMILAGSAILRRNEGTWKQQTLPSGMRAHSGSALSIGTDSFTIYGVSGTCDIDTGRVWEGPKDKPVTVACGPTAEPDLFLVARLENEALSLEIRDSDRKELQATVDHLPEFRSGNYRTPNASLMERIVYLPGSGTLVTLAAGGRDLIFRKLRPVQKSAR